MQIFKLLCDEYLTDQAIYEHFHISLRVVQNHIQHFKVKLGLDEASNKQINTRIALCMIALEKKLL
ncbi:hypothetical protein H6F32_15545 [Anabaena sp. FACHB-1237]|uniref:hypothetical protein n=1 Tax=Anabaena sp. FACHB-1237 TaxID=2692769 RepID=UPI0016808622|nr:hypothetical protein [Anabaena sp. FACHB-1237]MBD2138951.1 hypothetical protein [Anabaena sp. FACHB-1237]